MASKSTSSQQINTAKLPVCFQRFQTKELALYVSEAKITNKNAFNGDHFRSESHHEYFNNEKA